jgi:beta-1,4-mannosyl-glycoprotein beta-1,4-N-acetylglucosaminyltransferase
VQETLAPPFCGGIGGSRLSGGIPDAQSLASTAPPPIDCPALGLSNSRRPRPFIIDAFLISYETQTLLLRLLEIAETVDAFVILESDTTHSGRPRNFTFPSLAPCLNRWRDKIFYTVLRSNSVPEEIRGLPLNQRPFAIENFQRNQLAIAAAAAAQKLRSFSTKTLNADHAEARRVLVAVSDLDEIPRPQAYGAVLKCEGYREPVALTLDAFFYYDFRWRKQTTWALGPRIFILDESSSSFEGGYVPQNARGHIPPSPESIFIHGGWHVSYFLDTIGIKNKIGSFLHTELDIPRFNDLVWIQQSIDLGKDLFDRGQNEALSEVDCLDDDADIPHALKLNPQLLENFCPQIPLQSGSASAQPPFASAACFVVAGARTFNLGELGGGAGGALPIRHVSYAPESFGWPYTFGACGDVAPPPAACAAAPRSPVFQESGGKCFSLGSFETRKVEATNKGVTIAFSGGDGGRSSVITVECADVPRPKVVRWSHGTEPFTYTALVRARSGCAL